MARLLARAARWSLPVALIIAALVAVGGLGSVLFGPSGAAPAPAAVSGPQQTGTGNAAGSAAGALVPQDLPTAQLPTAQLPADLQPGTTGCRRPDRPLCPPSDHVADRSPGCCR